jgi:SAM-dependent methyltransferase
MVTDWFIDKIQDPLYRSKFVVVPDIIEEWLGDHGGLSGKDVLEFGCGEGTMALGMALRKNVQRVVGVEILDVYEQCLPIARKEIGLNAIPSNLQLRQIPPGGSLTQWGQFDFIYSWSVFEHVSQNMFAAALASIKAALKPGGLFFLQISPLYYSANGSHMGPWVPEPWAHLSMQHDMYYQRLLSAEETPPNVRSEWSVYIPLTADRETERAALWDTYVTLNKVTAPQLCRLVREAGFEIKRDYRTKTDVPVPSHLAEIYDEDILTTEQIVLLLSHA